MNKNTDYYAPPNPYKNAPSCGIDLLELSRYARRQGKKLRELTEEEIDRFRIRKEDVNENRKNR